MDGARYTGTDNTVIGTGISGAPAPRKEQKAWPIRSRN